jgi:hypothetical protein
MPVTSTNSQAHLGDLRSSLKCPLMLLTSAPINFILEGWVDSRIFFKRKTSKAQSWYTFGEPFAACRAYPSGFSNITKQLCGPKVHQNQSINHPSIFSSWVGWIQSITSVFLSLILLSYWQPIYVLFFQMLSSSQAWGGYYTFCHRIFPH